MFRFGKKYPILHGTETDADGKPVPCDLPKEARAGARIRVSCAETDCVFLDGVLLTERVFVMPEHPVQVEIAHKADGRIPQILLFDWFSQTVGTPRKTGYSELAVFTCSDTELIAEEWQNGGLPEERCTEMRIPSAAAAELYAVFRASGIETWETRSDCAGLCGRRTVCKYRSGSGYIYGSTDHMPPDGDRVLSALHDALAKWVRAK